MGRRSLPKIQGNLDLSRYFKTIEELPSENIAGALFDREAPLELEIGSGKGLFIAGATRKTPGHNFLGVELAYRYALMSAARLAKAGVENGVMINADAARVLREFIAPESLCAAHIYFPDPWWKNAHRKRRIVRPDVVKTIEERLEFGGRLHFWTDVREYFLTGTETIKLSTKLAGPFFVPERPAENEMDYLTHFERRTRLNEAPVYRAYFVKEPVKR
ncbi:MAG: tRNA (guanosine(46)-N7)-methyltransferase TrmB [Thermoguttaceae bacterium]|nr:tRNA (guanosine(46)-N7)-methyltransferase TrmB [Thermoguttaceae bacterium]